MTIGPIPFTEANARDRAAGPPTGKVQPLAGPLIGRHDDRPRTGPRRWTVDDATDILEALP